MTCELCQAIFEENKQLRKRIEQIEKRLNAYENPHAPSSKKRFPEKRSRSTGKPGQKDGHKGTTRPTPEPDETIELTLLRCPECDKPLNQPFRTEKRVIEETPEQTQLKVTEFLVDHYFCSCCGKEVVPVHPELPKEGRFGKMLISQITMMKFGDRMPHRKIVKALKRQCGIILSPATVLDITRRASEAMRPGYDKIKERIRKADVVNIDETSIKVNGETYWIWCFVAGKDVLLVIDKSRGKGVVEKTLGTGFKGTIVCDGWKSYPSFTKNLQRCWAHLLREADDVAKKHDEAKEIADELHSIFNECKEMLKKDPPPDKREQIRKAMEARLKNIMQKEFNEKTVNQFIGKITNGFDYWFTFVTNPKVEPTNNIAERALRESVVHRKIIGTLRNTKGTYIHETAMSMIATWENMGLNPFEEMINIYSSANIS